MFCLICGSNKIKQQKTIINYEKNKSNIKNKFCKLSICKNCNHAKFIYEKPLTQNNKAIKIYALNEISYFSQYHYINSKNKNLILNILPSDIFKDNLVFNNIINTNFKNKRIFEIKDLKKRLSLINPILKRVPDIILLNFLEIENDPIFLLANIYNISNKNTIVIIKLNNLRSLISDIFYSRKSSNIVLFKDWENNILIQKNLFSLKSIICLITISNFKIDFYHYLKFDHKNFLKLFFSIFFSYKGTINLYIKRNLS